MKQHRRGKQQYLRQQEIFLRFGKFQALLDKALSLGAAYIATGHYARLGYSDPYGRYTVCRPADRKKDQTYVLYGLTQRQVSRIKNKSLEDMKNELSDKE